MVSKLLPRLRMNLDFMASPVAERPGLMVRDPHNYSDKTLIIPPPLVALLEFFDGETRDLDVRELLVRETGDLQVGRILDDIERALDEAGFLENETYHRMREARHREFAESPAREAVHAGAAYPEEAAELRRVFGEYLNGSAAVPRQKVVGIAAPHVSPHGGWESYREAYRALGPEHKEKVFIVLGTSHYGEPDRFGLTRKNYRTPAGESRTERAWVDWLEQQAPEAVLMEDYCHASEHSIEFQVAFLQQIYGPEVRVLPVLVGPFARSIHEGGLPEDNDAVKAFLGALGELHARHKEELLWVLGVDMAHIGRRYGDPFEAVAYEERMREVAGQDRERIAVLEKGDALGFWERVQERKDDLKWCGSAPFYTFARAVPGARGELLRYQHWQIDPASVVSFAGMVFQE